MICKSRNYNFKSHVGCSCSVLISLVESSVTLDIFGIDGLCSNKDLIDEGPCFLLHQLYVSPVNCTFSNYFNLYPHLYCTLTALCQTPIISSLAYSNSFVTDLLSFSLNPLVYVLHITRKI